MLSAPKTPKSSREIPRKQIASMLVSVTLMGLSVSACGTSGPLREFCAIAKHPIVIQKTDVLTASTESGIIAYNEKGAEFCGWKPPGSK